MLMPRGPASRLFQFSVPLLCLLLGADGCALASEKLKIAVSERKLSGHTYVVGTALLSHPQSAVWRTLTDYKHATEIFSNLSKSEVVETHGNVVKLHQVVKPSYFPFTFDYVVDLTATPPETIEWHRASGSFEAYDGSWTLAKPAEGDPPNSTRVTYQVYLDANKFIPQWLLRRSLKAYMPEVFESLRRELSKHKDDANG